MTPDQFDNIMLNKSIMAAVLAALRAYDPSITTDANEIKTIEYTGFESADGTVLADGELIFKILAADIDDNRGFRGFVATVDDVDGGDEPIGLILQRFTLPDVALSWRHADSVTVGAKKTLVVYPGRSFVYNYPATI